LELYSFLLRYIQPHQRNVTQVLAFAAQSSHALVPPDAITPLLMAIANAFIAEHCRAEVIAAGLNGLYYICVRCPLAMDSTLLQDLAQYKGYQDKGVASAARSLIGLYREANPELLHRKDRGKQASMAMQRGTFTGPKAYGHVDVKTVPEGLELLVQQDEEEFAEAEEIDLDSDSDCIEEGSENDGEWQSVGSGDEDIEISDDDDEEDEADTEEGSADASGEETASVAAAVVEKKTDRVQKMLEMATQKIFTPADFAMLKRKRLEAAVEASSGPVKHHPAQKKARTQNSDDEGDAFDDEEDSDAVGQGPSEVVKPAALQVKTKKPKADYAARMDSIRAGREGRLEFGSKKGKEGRGSSTNAEKIKKKNQTMMAHKFSVRQKKQRSLRDKQKVIKAHAKRQKLKRK
jgi:protein SDA1